MQLRGSELVIGVEDAGAAYPVTIDPTWTEEAILTANDASQSAAFGLSVSVDGDTAIVGARGADLEGVPDAGAAYVFTRRGSAWTQQAVLSANDKTPTAYFGWSVSLSGNTAVIGGPQSLQGGFRTGAAYVFTRSGSTWSQQAKLVASDKSADSTFGTAVSVSGDVAVIGASFADPGNQMNAGAAYVFARGGSVWTEQAILTGNSPQPGDSFGASVSVHGETAVIGAVGDDGEDGQVYDGSAYVFTRSGNAWSGQPLVASIGQSGVNFGYSVSVYGDTALVGARSLRVNQQGAAGAAIVFTRNGSGWTEQQILVPNNPQRFGYFGWSVSLHGDIAVIGSPTADRGGTIDAGAAYVYARSGTTWAEQSQLSASNTNAFAHFGHSVVATDAAAFVGAYNANLGAVTGAGAVYVYDNPSTIPVSVAFSSLGVPSGKSVTGTVILGSAPSTNTLVNLISNNSALSVPSSVTVAAGTTSAQFTATSSSVFSDTLVTVTGTGSGLVSGSGQLTVRTPRVGSISFNADSLLLGQTAIGTVSLQSAAPAGGTLVTLINSHSSALDCPATVMVPAGQTRANFTVTGHSVAVATTVKVESTPSFNEKSDTLVVYPGGLQQVSVADFVVGGVGQGQVTLTAPAPPGGAVVSLSGNSSRLGLPATVTVPEGATTASFALSGTGALLNATVRATYLGITQSDMVSVFSVYVASVSSSTATLAVGGRATITVTLNSATPQDLPIVISIQKASVVTAPAQLVIPAGSSSGTFEITGLAPGITNVYARLLSQGVKSAKVTVTSL